MAWVKLDDHFDEHDKVLAAGPEAMWVFIRALAYCNRRETDGYVPDVAINRIGSDYGPQKRKKLMARLVEVGLMHVPGHECGPCPDPPVGWQVHDYADYQPTKERKEAERAEARERMARARARKKKGRGSPPVRTEQVQNDQRSSVNPGPVPGVPNGTQGPPPVDNSRPTSADAAWDQIEAYVRSHGSLDQDRPDPPQWMRALLAPLGGLGAVRRQEVSVFDVRRAYKSTA